MFSKGMTNAMARAARQLVHLQTYHCRYRDTDMGTMRVIGRTSRESSAQ
jgi:hypothetical protein